MAFLYNPIIKRDSTTNGVTSPQFATERGLCLMYFNKCNEEHQIKFVEHLLSHMSSDKHGYINTYLKPMLQRNFISLLQEKGLDHVSENILSYLDGNSLCAAELVCKEWYRVISKSMLWKKLIERKVRTDTFWRGLAERRGWIQYLFEPKPGEHHQDHFSYKALFIKIIQDKENIESNWHNGHFLLHSINFRSELQDYNSIYCLQHDDKKIVSGYCDNTIKIWDRNTLECVKVLVGHTGPVLCLQYDDKVIVSGSSDNTVRVWNVVTGDLVNTLLYHIQAVLHLRFNNKMTVTCSLDQSIAVWSRLSSGEMTFRVINGHQASVNVVEFDDKYIVSGSSDCTIKVWNASSCEFVRTLIGHKYSIVCLQYRDRLVVSGSSDKIRLWDIECGSCLRVLEGHEAIVRCISFNSKIIVSGSYDRTIKVWDLVAAINPSTPASTLCLGTLTAHKELVFHLQCDEFQLVSCSHDDTMITWDFLNYNYTNNSAAGSTNIAAMHHSGSTHAVDSLPPLPTDFNDLID